MGDRGAAIILCSRHGDYDEEEEDYGEDGLDIEDKE